MSFSWTPHRFSGGALALDVANSVILRHDDERRTDRFEAPGQMESFPKAAANFCAERALFGDILPVRQENKPDFIDLREAIDRYFRARDRSQQPSRPHSHHHQWPQTLELLFHAERPEVTDRVAVQTGVLPEHLPVHQVRGIQPPVRPVGIHQPHYSKRCIV